MSFVATPPAPASPPASVVEADGTFWPAIDVNALRNALRLGDSVVSHERLTAAIEGSVASLMLELRAWRAAQEAAGAAALAEVDPTLHLNGDPIAVTLWNRAVRFAAAAEINDGYADLTATDEGGQRGAERRTVADDYRRQSITAVRQLSHLGTLLPDITTASGGCLVDLI